MNGRNQGGRGTGGGQGQGGGMGQGQGGGGRGRMGGPSAGGAVGTCRCPQCGHTQPHERGVPCTQVKCPQCGTSMFRE
jgi:hypothetical protein